jgi:hypothetical protein
MVFDKPFFLLIKKRGFEKLFFLLKRKRGFEKAKQMVITVNMVGCASVLNSLTDGLFQGIFH